ncbi:MAG: hypothetical protein R3C56_26700 [Pirellulaceae bacterium]
MLPKLPSSTDRAGSALCAGWSLPQRVANYRWIIAAYAGERAQPLDASEFEAPLPTPSSATTATIGTVLSEAELVALAGENSGISGGLPMPFLRVCCGPLNLKTLWIIFPFAFVLCGVGLIES